MGRSVGENVCAQSAAFEEVHALIDIDVRNIIKAQGIAEVYLHTSQEADSSSTGWLIALASLGYLSRSLEAGMDAYGVTEVGLVA